MSREKKSAPGLVVGGPARIDLLPPEVRARMRSRRARRGLGMLVVASVLATGAGFALASLNAGLSASALAAEQAKTDALLQQQAEFIEVTQLTREKAGIEQALLVGASTEILWQPTMASIASTLPSGSVLTGVQVTSSSPIAPLATPSLPLAKARVANLVLTITAPDLASVGVWLAQLPSVVGYAGAVLNSAELGDGGVRAQVTLALDDLAWANRFAPEAETDETDETDESETAEEES